MTAVLRERIYDFICTFKKCHGGLPPTRREINRALKISSLAHVTYHLEALENQGLIRLGHPGQSRWIEVVGERWFAPNENPLGGQPSGL